MEGNEKRTKKVYIKRLKDLDTGQRGRLKTQTISFGRNL